MSEESQITNAIEDIKRRISEMLDTDAVIVYSQSEIEKLPEADSRLINPDHGFVSVLYAGMAAQDGAKVVNHGMNTVGRFGVVVHFKGDGVRMQGLSSPVDMIQFMTQVRKALIGQPAPHNQKYSFVRESPISIPNRGDGYAQEWKLPLSAKS
ncbi:hypothetical protein VPEG_00101 [Vibrio phage SIO-2]|uniref:hypothetical protein n=1 Tax=Vibrio phage SIO-2 TaxID=700512 RepID=UPI0002357C8A|nr:hypothetical protein VPEG_00101 [Vibrio phage SIO-2]AET42251.1 hypothetical protein VPEG_00101 [Vibrio phage SIO-2]QKE60701.1 tail completion protein [Vibrio phage vB_VhaS-VHB1]